MKKTLLLTFFLLILINYGFSFDNTGDIHKDNTSGFNKKPMIYEFGIGGAYSTLIIPEMTYGHDYSVNFTFEYYIKKYYALGVSSKLGFDMLFFIVESRPVLYNIFSSHRMINKFGDFEKKGFFYTETGFDLTGVFYFYFGPSLYGLFMGPSVFFGYQKSPVERFGLIIGGSFAYQVNVLSPGNSLSPRGIFSNFICGIETRFLFKIKSKNFIQIPETIENETSAEIQIKSAEQGDLYVNHKYIKSMEPGEEFIYDRLYSGYNYIIDMVYSRTVNEKKKIENIDGEEIYVQPDKSYILNFNLTKNDIENNYWKRHFFNILTGAGFSYTNVEGVTVNSDGTYSTGSYDLWNGSASFCFGYIYGFNKYFGFGASFSAAFAFPGIWASGFAALASFMFGDLDNHKIAFLLDVGGGGLFMQKFGIYIKGFTFKFSHCLTLGTIGHGSWSGMHNFTFEFGYIINWKIKNVDRHKLFVIPSS